MDIKKFIDQIEDGVDVSLLSYSGGVIRYNETSDVFLVAEQQSGAEETFSVGQPVYDVDGNLMGYLGIGLFNALDYSCDETRCPVEFWQICLPTSWCSEGKRIVTYWQANSKIGTEVFNENK